MATEKSLGRGIILLTKSVGHWFNDENSYNQWIRSTILRSV